MTFAFGLTYLLVIDTVSKLVDNEKLVPDWSRNIKIISRTDRTKDQIKILLGPDERSEEGLIEFLFGPE